MWFIDIARATWPSQRIWCGLNSDHLALLQRCVCVWLLCTMQSSLEAAVAGMQLWWYARSVSNIGDMVCDADTAALCCADTLHLWMLAFIHRAVIQHSATCWNYCAQPVTEKFHKFVKCTHLLAAISAGLNESNTTTITTTTTCIFVSAACFFLLVYGRPWVMLEMGYFTIHMPVSVVFNWMNTCTKCCV